MSRLKKVEVAGFQAVRQASFPLAPFTVILGETNQGKSSLLRAIESWGYNRVGKEFINYDATEAKVRITLEDGHVVEWRKSATLNRFSLDALVYDKVGRGELPREITEVTGIFPYAFGDDLDVRLNYAHQHDAPFLIAPGEWPGSKVSKILGRLTNVGPVFLSIRDCATAQKRARNEQELVHRQKDQVERELLDYRGLDVELATVAAQEKLLRRAEAVEARLEAVRHWLSRWSQASRQLSVAQADCEAHSLRLGQLEGLELATIKYRALRELEEKAKRLAGFATELEKIAHHLPPPDLSTLIARYDQLSSLSSFVLSYKNLAGSIERTREEMERAERLMTQSVQEIEAWCLENPTCPLCGGLFEQDR